MKTIRLIDIFMQAAIAIALIGVYIIGESHSELKSAILIFCALFGPYQLLSFIIVSWKYANRNYRFIYFFMLMLVFAPLFIQNIKSLAFLSADIYEKQYWFVLCPVVAVYYFTICVLEYKAINK
jgi:hypothetical protein